MKSEVKDSVERTACECFSFIIGVSSFCSQKIVLSQEKILFLKIFQASQLFLKRFWARFNFLNSDFLLHQYDKIQKHQTVISSFSWALKLILPRVTKLLCSPIFFCIFHFIRLPVFYVRVISQVVQSSAALLCLKFVSHTPLSGTNLTNLRLENRNFSHHFAFFNCSDQ